VNSSVPDAAVDWAAWDAVLFDLDGVITPTATVHEHAWCELFAEWDCTRADYLAHIDGKPRYDGVRDFLASRQITLPEGSADDPPGTDTVAALGNRKNMLFNEIIDRDGIVAYPGSRALLEFLERTHIPAAVVSSSKNARRVLAAAGLGERFEVVVDGLTADEVGLAGKPDPAMFLHAADRLGVDPTRCVVIEDAVSGVQAGSAGGFGLVIGVDRGSQSGALSAAGAHIVVGDLDQTLEIDPP